MPKNVTHVWFDIQKLIYMENDDDNFENQLYIRNRESHNEYDCRLSLFS